MAGRELREPRRLGRERRRIAIADRGGLASAAPERLGLLLAERERLLGPVDLEPEAVLAPGRDLADHRAADGSPVGLELHHGRVLGLYVPRLARAVALLERSPARGPLPFGQRGDELRVDADQALPRDELGEVAPVRADVGERARRPAEPALDPPVVVLAPQEPVLEVGAVDQPNGPGGA